MCIWCHFTVIACIVSDIASSTVDAHSGYDGWWWQQYGNEERNGRLSIPWYYNKSVLKPVAMSSVETCMYLA